MKQTIQKVLMLVGGLLLGLLLAEVLCKFVDIRTSAARRITTRAISRVSEIPGVRYELIPGVTERTPGQQHPVRVNRLGFRGKDITEAKPPGTIRIAVLGDSIAFGRTYADEAIFPALLESRLNQEVPGTHFEVINAALSGRDTWEEAAVLEHRVLPLEPDIVILQICMNDHVRLPPPANDRVGAFGERPWNSYSSLLRLLDTRLPGFREVHVKGLTALGIDGRTPAEVLMDQVVRPDQMLDVGPHWQPWSQELLRIAALARDHGATPLFLVFPVDVQLTRGDDHTLPVLTDLAAEHQIPFLDMLHFFRKHPDKMLRDYTHPSRAGHYLTAGELARVIAASMQPME